MKKIFLLLLFFPMIIFASMIKIDEGIYLDISDYEILESNEVSLKSGYREKSYLVSSQREGLAPIFCNIQEEINAPSLEKYTDGYTKQNSMRLDFKKQRKPDTFEKENGQMLGYSEIEIEEKINLVSKFLIIENYGIAITLTGPKEINLKEILAPIKLVRKSNGTSTEIKD